MGVERMLTSRLQQFADEVVVEIKKEKDIEDFLKKNYNIGIEDLNNLSMTELLNIQDELDLRPYKVEV